MATVIVLLFLGLPTVLVVRFVRREHVPHDGRNPVDLGDAIAKMSHRGLSLDRQPRAS